MLFGSLRINLWSGVVGFILTFVLSVGSNLLTTSLIRGLIAFVFWFLLAFVLRWTLGVVARPDLGNAQSRASSQVDGVGGNLDLTTPDENENLNELLKPKPEQTDEGKNGFAPLNPPKLVSNKDPEELAKAVRHLTDK
ncbi:MULTISPECIES: hypothetical protein [Paenibacillus]|uniref:hypothetical protein n=1 Tax=Paenibacillus TaxID=44249 RepID=UPI0006C66753|nr:MULTISPECIES: hypothetical protein [Paenibacillus]KOS03984.1 hypothetical protein AM598_03470 [Paenibacillus polymyxa]PNQ81247.1 hypothetical protein C1T21_08050 [Paenibacillus sp. F4]